MSRRFVTPAELVELFGSRPERAIARIKGRLLSAGAPSRYNRRAIPLGGRGKTYGFTTMLEILKVHGFRTLLNTELQLTPLTIMIGKNGVGKTTILNVLEIIGRFARGGPERAFGPPPWSLAWQRTKGFGHIQTVDFGLEINSSGTRYRYDLRLDEKRNDGVRVEEERLTRLSDHTAVACYDKKQPPKSGTILSPDPTSNGSGQVEEIQCVSQLLQAFQSYELNPSVIERGNDPKITFISRDGFGVAGFLANLKDKDPETFASLEARFKQFRPETEAIKIWSNASDYFWGLRDQGQTTDFAAVHLSWGDRQLMGLLCVLYATPAGATIAFEEIDRGFHPARYSDVIALLSEAAYHGLDGRSRIQIVATTHSPSFVNKLSDREDEIRMVTRVPTGGTLVRPLKEIVHSALGTENLDQPLGEVWEMGLLEDVIEHAMK